MSIFFKFVKGDDFVIPLTIKDQAGNAVNLTGVTGFVWSIYAPGQSATPLFSKSLGSGVAITSAASGQVEITVDDTDSDLATAGQTYYHTALITDADGKELRVRDTDGAIGTALCLE